MIRALFLTVALGALGLGRSFGEVTLLNASFDLSRELFEAYNAKFTSHWKAQTGDTIVIQQSHAGSSKQARAVIDGLEADVVTLNQSSDVEAIVARGLINADWRQKLPHSAAPFTSTITFLVRRGNSKAIRGWEDLVRPGVSVILPNPKTSGNGRYGYLAALGFAQKKFGADQAKIKEFLASLLKNVPVFDTGGRGASTTFVQRQVGDVLVTFEAEILSTVSEHKDGGFEAVIPTTSIEAEMPVAVVDRVAKRHNTVKPATAYLEFLFSEPGQDLAAQWYFRPQLASVAQRYTDRFPRLSLFNVEDVFGSWASVQKTHFAEGGVFDQILQEIRPR